MLMGGRSCKLGCRSLKFIFILLRFPTFSEYSTPLFFPISSLFLRSGLLLLLSVLLHMLVFSYRALPSSSNSGF